MNRKLQYLAVCGLLACSITAQAEISIRARAGVGAGSYDASGDVHVNLGTSCTNNCPAVKYSSDYTAIPIGLTFISDEGIYFDMMHQFANGNSKFAGTKGTLTRDESTLTIGTRHNQFSVYMGYKQAETNNKWSAPLSFRDKFSSSGFITGFGWNQPLPVGVLNASLGVGFLNAQYSYDKSQPALESNTTLGGSVGISYGYAFTENLNVTADYKWQSYNYSFDIISAKMKEDFSQLGVTASYSF